VRLHGGLFFRGCSDVRRHVGSQGSM
jgi:hypothetical protein